MGIKFFKTYCKRNRCEGTFKIFERSQYVYTKEKKNTVIVIDSSSFLFDVFGRFQHSIQLVGEYIGRLKAVCDKNHLELVFVVEGLAPSSKVNEIIKRLTDKGDEVIQFFKREHSLQENPVAIYKFLFRPFYIYLKQHGFEMVRAVGESDQRIVQEAINRKAYGVVTNDTDFYLSSIRHIFFPDAFNHLMNKVSTRTQPYLSFEMAGIAVEKVKGLLKIKQEFLPFFSCIAGNDYTKSFNDVIINHLKINEIKRYSQEFDKIGCFLKQYKGDTAMLEQQINECLDDENKQFFQFGLSQARSMLRGEEEEPIVVEGIDLYNPFKRLSTIRNCFGTQAHGIVYTQPDYDSPYKITIPLRKIQYDIAKPNSEIVEYFLDNEHSLDKGQIIKSTTLASRELFEMLTLVGFDNTFLDIVRQSLNNETEWWKTVFALTMKYIDMQCTDFKGFGFLLYEWYSLCLQYDSSKQTEVIPPNATGDDRLPIHLYNYFSTVVMFINEIIIDLCDIPDDYILQLKSPFINTFVQDYHANESHLWDVMKELRSTDKFFDTLCNLFADTLRKEMN